MTWISLKRVQNFGFTFAFFCQFCFKNYVKIGNNNVVVSNSKNTNGVARFDCLFLAKTCGKFFKIQSSLTPTTAWCYLWSEILPLWCCFSAVLCSFIFHLFVISHFFSQIHICKSFFSRKTSNCIFQWQKNLFLVFPCSLVFFCSDPPWRRRNYILKQVLFWPIDIFIVEICERYH